MEVVSFSVGEAGRNEDLHGQRYLSQVWGGGTLCAISNEPRSIEVQVSDWRQGQQEETLMKDGAVSLLEKTGRSHFPGQGDDYLQLVSCIASRGKAGGTIPGTVGARGRCAIADHGAPFRAAF
jgi:hypothetical protein